MFSLAVGLQDVASLYVGYLPDVRLFLKLIMRAVIREDASTESGLLIKQMHGSFYTKRGQAGGINCSCV